MMNSPTTSAPANPNAELPRLGQGNLPFTLDGVTYTLKPTISAMQVLSNVYNGLQGVLDRLQRVDIQAIEDVLVQGLGPTFQGARQRKQLMEKVLGAGITDDTGGFSLLCQKYILILMRGGRPLPMDQEEGDADESGMQAKNGTSSS